MKNTTLGASIGIPVSLSKLHINAYMQNYIREYISGRKFIFDLSLNFPIPIGNWGFRANHDKKSHVSMQITSHYAFCDYRVPYKDLR